MTTPRKVGTRHRWPERLVRCPNTVLQVLSVTPLPTGSPASRRVTYRMRSLQLLASSSRTDPNWRRRPSVLDRIQGLTAPPKARRTQRAAAYGNADYPITHACTRKVLMTLAENTPFEMTVVDFSKGEHK